ncbi:glycosyltransferase family 39 protein [Roseibium suaedae]|uniref:Dolichyl-phosphate-mannose-protein mannosyltransferase n=1 Tax=Roseibium suaedae TaxID=735517 RepID=A0A1M7H7F5_9HYPH|nr:glycosyltransferase family 39 protein [Roseibium suaedae]SHM24007.1 Dolichyl-phosphate-mannose-protein mannosyltransferase [Roseibium suaedae]
MSHDTLAPKLSPGSRREQLWTWAIGGILLLAAALRLPYLDRTSLWYDEAVSWSQSKGTLTGLLAQVAGDNYPPLHNLMLWATMKLGGDSEIALRLPSALCGLLAVWLVYLLGKTVFSRTAGLLAATLLALSPFHVWYSTEARMYSVFAATGLLYLLGIARLLTASPHAPQTRNAGLATLGGVLFLYSHAYAPFSIAGAGAVLVLLVGFNLLRSTGERRDNRSLLLALIATALAGAAFLPWLAVLLARARHVVDGGFWIAYPDLNFLTVMVREITGSEYAFLILVVLAALALLLPGTARKRANSSALVLAGFALAPWVIAYLISVTLRPILFDRYLIAAFPVLLLLASAGAERLLSRCGALALLSVMLVWTAGPLNHALRDKIRPEWRSIAETYLKDRGKDAPILLHKPFALPALAYYLKDQAQPVLVATAGDLAAAFDQPEVWLLICHSGKTEMQDMIDAVPAAYHETGRWRGFGWGTSGLTLLKFEAEKISNNER